MLSPGFRVERSSTSMAASPEEKLNAYFAPSTAASCSSKLLRVGLMERL